MAAFPQTITNQAVDLGGGFEDPMDPCTMCQQGQMEIQNAYNELTQSCNACQTQQNLQQLQTQGCQGCAQAQQVIQKVQQQSTGCASCGTQPTQFSQLAMPQTGNNARTAQMPLSAGQPMLMPLTGTSNQQLLTVPMQPAMMAGQLPIAVEMGPPRTPGQFIQPQFTTLPTSSMQPQTISSGGMQTTQPIVVGMTTTQPMVMTNQPSVTPNIPQPQPMMVTQPAVVTQIPQPQPMMVTQPAPVNVIPTPPPPPPPMMVAQPAPTFNIPSLTPAQIAAAQQIAQAATPQIPVNITGAQLGALGAGGFTGYGVGGGKAGPGAGGGISIGPEGQLNYSFNIAAGPGVGNTGIGGLLGGFGPGAFDVHRPDLHAGGGWHNTLPMGALENVFNLY